MSWCALSWFGWEHGLPITCNDPLLRPSKCFGWLSRKCNKSSLRTISHLLFHWQVTVELQKRRFYFSYFVENLPSLLFCLATSWKLLPLQRLLQSTKEAKLLVATLWLNSTSPEKQRKHKDPYQKDILLTAKTMK